MIRIAGSFESKAVFVVVHENDSFTLSIAG
jgi:hypothetical protein